jgi:mRNA interferase RelE/StbE
LDKYLIAETDTFISKITTPDFKKLYKKITEYIYPQLQENPYYGLNIKKLKGKY